MDSKTVGQQHRPLISNVIYVLFFLLLCRLLANYFIPLNDATEARYGEIARKMLETGNWITLQHDYGVPFWAKPPLSTWLSAVAMLLFGVNEFAARLPNLLLSLAVLCLILNVVKKQSGELTALVATLVLSSTFFFFLDAGTVMTDPALLFCTTLATVAFWHTMLGDSKIWSYVFFGALGLGLLAKGPIAVALVGLSVFLWVLWRRQWVHLWQRFPWISGSFLAIAIALPWYIMAEIRTPGFLNYFIIGEHLGRFLTPGWTGDKYGIAHHVFKGTIWIYALVGMLPWSYIALRWLITSTNKKAVFKEDDQGWLSFLLICMVVPLIFFTFASNIIYPYVFPALPAFAMLYSEIWHRSSGCEQHLGSILKGSLLTGCIFFIATLLFQVQPELIAKTQKPVIAEWLKQHPSADGKLVYWHSRTEFSAQFYSGGRVVATHDMNNLCKLLSDPSNSYLAVNESEMAELPQALLNQFIKIKEIHLKGDNLWLMQSSKPVC